MEAAALVFTPHSIIVTMGHAKRGLEQKAIIDHPAAVQWLLRYFAAHPPGKVKVFESSYSRFNRWLQRAVAGLGVEMDAVSTHGLRRGGATHLLGHMPLPEILLRGRWASERSAREYLRRGEVQQLRFSSKFPRSVWARVMALCNEGVEAWIK